MTAISFDKPKITKSIDHHLSLKKFLQMSHFECQVQHTQPATKSLIHEHFVEGFRATAALHEVALRAEKTQLLFVDAHAVV